MSGDPTPDVRGLVAELAAGFALPPVPAVTGFDPRGLGDGAPAAPGAAERPAPAVVRWAEECLTCLLAVRPEHRPPGLAEMVARVILAGAPAPEPPSPLELALEVLAGEYAARERLRAECRRLGLPPPATRAELTRWAAVVLDYPEEAAPVLRTLQDRTGGGRDA